MLNLTYIEQQDFAQYFADNKEKFNDLLASRAKEIIETINQITELDETYILQSAHKVVRLLNEENEHGLILQCKGTRKELGQA